MPNKNLSIGNSPPTMPELSSNVCTHKFKCEDLLGERMPDYLSLINLRAHWLLVENKKGVPPGTPVVNYQVLSLFCVCLSILRVLGGCRSEACPPLLKRRYHWRP